MIVCFDIGGSAIKGALARSPADMTVLGRKPTPLDDFDAFTASLKAFITEAEAPDDAPIAISITGVIDPADGVIKCANIPCIDGTPLAALLSERLQRPVLVANDADCFALAEAGEGAGRGHEIVFGVILGTGVGGGLVIDGGLVSGAGGYAGEWGHGPVAATRVGEPPIEIPRFACGCGLAGCVDTVGGARGMERLHRHLHGLEMSSQEIMTAWMEGDAQAERTIDIQIELLAGPLALVANITGAHIMPVGGGLASATRFIERLDKAVRPRILRRTNVPLVVPGICRIEPGLIGAAMLARGKTK